MAKKKKLALHVGSWWPLLRGW